MDGKEMERQRMNWSRWFSYRKIAWKIYSWPSFHDADSLRFVLHCQMINMINKVSNMKLFSLFDTYTGRNVSGEKPFLQSFKVSTKTATGILPTTIIVKKTSRRFYCKTWSDSTYWDSSCRKLLLLYHYWNPFKDENLFINALYRAFKL